MKIFKIIAVLAVVLLAAACGGSDDASKVASKIQSNEQLTESDYKVMVDYCGKYAESAQKIQDQINNLPVDSEESEKLNEDMSDLASKYPLVSEFFGKITTATEEEVGPENVKLINKYAPLMWFSAPEWANVRDDPSVVGFIEEMPSSDTTGVISSGDGVEVNK